MKKVSLIVTLILTGWSISSCEKVTVDKSSCNYMSGRKFNGTAIDGSLPYTSFYLNDDNKSIVTATTMEFTSGDEWASTITYDETVSGTTEYDKVINRKGTYECTDGNYTLVNDLNQASGEGWIEEGILYLQSSTVLYEFE